MKNKKQFFHGVLFAFFAVVLVLPVSGAGACAVPKMKVQWQNGIFGSGIGLSGISLYDLDRDDKLEIIAGGSESTFGSDNFWYILKKHGASYSQIWISRTYPSISRIVVGDINDDSVPEIYVCTADGSIYVYNGRTRKETGLISVGAAVKSMVIADVDSDGSKEIVATDGTKIYVYSGTFGIKWVSSAYGGDDIAVGNVDNDPDPEIVTTVEDTNGYVIDGVSHELKWNYPNGFGYLLRLSDIDSDGKDEIIGADSWYYITAFDADMKSPKWQITTDLDIDALQVVDTDADGIPEILYGDGQWGAIHCYNAVSTTEMWFIDNPEHGVTDIAFGDVDRDGSAEVIWGAGASSTGPDYLYVADAVNHTIEWSNIHVDGPLSAVDVGDIDGDKEDEIVMVSFDSNSGYDSGVIHIFDATTHRLKWQHMLDNMDWMGVRSVKIRDVDGDGKREFVVTTANIYDGMIQVYNGSTHQLKRQSAGYDGNYFTAIDIGDVDNDGKVEIVAGQGKEHTGAPGVYVIVFDGLTLTEKWKSINLPSTDWGEVYDVKIGDLDGDGHKEIMASVAGDRVYVFDGVTHQMKWLGNVPAYALEAADMNGDSHKELLIGKEDGTVEVYNGLTFAFKAAYKIGNSAVVGLRVDDINGRAGRAEWLVSDSSTFYVFDHSAEKIMTSNIDLGDSVAAYNHINVRDLDDDGKKEIVIGTSYILAQFEVALTPLAPACTKAKAISPTEIRLRWSDFADNEKGFYIERKAGTCRAAEPWSQIASVGANVTVYFDSTVTPSSDYSYRVRAYNSNGNSSYSACSHAFTSASGILVSPSTSEAPSTSSITTFVTLPDCSDDETGFEVMERPITVFGYHQRKR
jgi:hypothetical protein